MYRIAWFLIVGFVMAGCKRQPSASPADNTRSSAAYNPGSSTLHPRYGIYHDAPGHSVIYGKIFPSELQFSAANTEGKMKASFSVRYSLYEVTDTTSANIQPLIADTLHYEITKERGNQRFFINIPLTAPEGKRYLAYIVTRDNYRKAQTDNYISIDKITPGNSQYYLVYNAADHTPLFWPFVAGGQSVIVESAMYTTDSVYFCYYPYLPANELSAGGGTDSPFASRPDSVWKLPYQRTITYSIKYQGMYLVKTDTTDSAGLALLHPGVEFPKITRTDEMTTPLAIIAQTGEMEKIRSETNTKLAVDDFWLGRTDNPDRARELIRIFYNRAYIANYYFTNHQPGFRTDRGITFVLLGPPARVIRDLHTEKWIYFDKNYKNSTIYLFRNYPNALSPENFILRMDESKGEGLKKSINAWRTGQILTGE